MLYSNNNNNYHNNLKTQQHFAPKTPLKAYSIFFLAASFYLYEFILQVAPSVMAEPMMQTFKINAGGFGVISAFYFYSYAPMQLPAGVLFDRYGPRKLMTMALILCAFGSFFFAATDSVITAAMGRFFIGIGSAFSFIGVLVLLSRWFPSEKFALFAGIAQMMSSIGAMFGEVPLAALVQYTDWRYANFVLAAIGLVLATLLWIFIRDYPHSVTQQKPTTRLRDEWHRLRMVCRRKYTWITGAYAFTIWTPIAVFAALWGVPFLQTKYNIGVVLASSLCSMVWLGIGIGSPALGWISDYFRSRKLALIISASCGLLSTLLIIYTPDIKLGHMYLVLLFFGFGAGGQTVSFAVVKDNNKQELVGTACGFNNLSVLIGGAIFQPVVGLILQRLSNAEAHHGVHIYSLANYQKALLIMPLCYMISLILAIFFIKESHSSSLS